MGEEYLLEIYSDGSANILNLDYENVIKHYERKLASRVVQTEWINISQQRMFV